MMGFGGGGFFRSRLAMGQEGVYLDDMSYCGLECLG